MAFKQSNNPISRKTSPLRAGGFTMDQLDKTTTSEQLKSQEDAKTLTSKDDLKRFPGDDEGRLEHKISPEEYNDQYTAPSRKASPLNDKFGSKTIGEHGFSANKYDKHVSTVHARWQDAKDRVQEKKDAKAKESTEQTAPSRKTHKK